MMTMDGSVDDAHTILGVRKNYFPPDFKEYIQKEQLNWSRFDGNPDYKERPTFGWVFWCQLDNSADLIRHALQKLISKEKLDPLLVQFWAPTKTSEGRTLLTTQFQPFALGTTSYFSDARNSLCEYRMGMCREYNNSFYADAESGEDQLGLPGRVFLNKLAESTPDVKYYSVKEYPQRDLALRCGINDSWGLPVFERSSHICVGVLEIVSLYDIDCHDKEFLGRVYDIFQEFGLRCFDGYEHCKMQYWDKNEALTAAFQELKMVYESVCNIHNLPLALAWVSCHSCNDLLESQFQFSVLDYSTDEEDYDDYTYDLVAFAIVSKVSHLRKGKVTGRILPFPELLYCSDVKQFSIAEFPLVPYARLCKLGGWFTMCLQSGYTEDELYVLEFFLPESDENNENILTKLRLILGTMEEYFKTFKLASGQGLGEALSVEVINFQNGQKSHSIQMLPATRCIPGLELLQDGGVMLQQDQQDQPSMDAINSGMHVVSEAQNYNLPILDSLHNGKVTKQVDSSDQQSMDPSNKGQNAVTAERNILVVSSSKKGKRMTQDEEHKKAGVRIEVSLEEILKCSKMRREYAAKELKVSISTLKRVCRDHGIHRWPPRNVEKVQLFLPSPVENQGQTSPLNSDLLSNEALGSAANIKTGFQGADMVTVRAKCEKYTIKFCLSLSSRLVELQQEVAKRLNLRAETYHITYKDEKDELILIACDEDLQGAQPQFSFTDNSADLKIRRALQKLMEVFTDELYCSLVQFWAATKTSEGRTLLTTQFQPFALGTSYFTVDRNSLCEYRMGMCREYNNKFYADAESGEDQLGLPGRVFLNKLPEYTPHVEHYTLKEYPQLDLALRCKIGVCWAVPVFEHSSHTCVGVLEIVSLYCRRGHDKEFLGFLYDIFQKFGLRFFDGYEPYKMQCWDKNEARTVAFHELKMVSKSVCYIHNLPLALAWVSCHSCNDLLQSLFQFCVLYSTDENDDDLDDFMNVSKDCLLKKGQVTGRILPFPNLLYCSDVKQFSIAEFPLVPYARNCELGGWFTMCLQSSYTRDELYVLEFFLPESDEIHENILSKLRLILGTMEEYFKTFKLASGQGLGEALSVEVIDFQNGQKSPSIQMIPASRCIPSLELLQDGGVMLQQDQQDQPSMDVTNSGMYVVSEAQNYNLPILDSLQNGKVTKQVDSSDQQSMDPSNKGENAVTAEQNILLVSSSKKGKRKAQDEEHKKVGVRIEVSLEEILECSKMRREDAAKELKVSISKLKRVCRDFGINRWPPRNIKKAQPFRPLPVENLGQTPQLNCDLPSNQASTSVARTKPSFQDADKVTIRATCEKNTIKFRLSLSSRLVEMQQEVAKRLNLEGGTYYIKYKDEEDVLILIACDEDLQDCLHTSRSLDISSIAVLLELK
ncbi:hypothetical protein RHMOL_Rhmol02G0304900 [Rhododendron molle]|uniref:Uncharacterized protein n=1 Tax=Rhododendron molle TaxID=49168 RepID=A0ACC0PWE5_RHOML|nr:hypothetical protein RHMOL_Rhmol02G0304900 [Rhododendron molle]